MKMTPFKKMLSCFLCAVLIAATVLSATGCEGTKTLSPEDTTPTDGVVVTLGADTTESSDTQDGEDNTGNSRGEGSIPFIFTVTDIDGTVSAFEIHTDRKTVGDALIALGLIAGEAGPYGLYVKTVNGITYDYDRDGKYWSFYVNGAYAASGVDTTDIVPGDTYSFVAE